MPLSGVFLFLKLWNQRLLHDQQLSQHHPELLRAPCQLLHLFHHLLGRGRGRILKRRRLGADDDVFEFLTEVVAALSHLGSHLRSLGLSRERVADEHQFVRAEDDELAVGHENLGRLIGVDGSEEGVDGVGDGGDVLLALLVVEEEELLVAAAQLGGGRVSGVALGQLVGQRVVEGRNPARHVVVDWPADFLLQPLKLRNLQGDKRADSRCFRPGFLSSFFFFTQFYRLGTLLSIIVLCFHLCNDKDDR